MDIVNSILNNGECLHLFTNDEMEGLYHAIAPSIKREYPNMILDPKKFFNSRVRKNLHICLTLTAESAIFQTILKQYPKMISCCQIYWIKGINCSFNMKLEIKKVNKKLNSYDNENPQDDLNLKSS